MKKVAFLKCSMSLLLLGFMAFNVLAQEQDIIDYRMRFGFKTVKLHDNSRMLEVSFIAANKKDRKDRLPVYDAPIEFFNILSEDEVSLGTSKTSKEGIAQITLPQNQSYLMDSEGRINFRAVFEGTDVLDSEEKEISIKDAYLNLDLIEKDSVKTVLVKGFIIDSLGVKMPMEQADVIISIEGMLSKMIIDEGTIEDGSYEFEMPTDLPGDSNGDITVYSIIEDHDDFGDMVQKKTENWGIFNKQTKRENNALWSEAAPIWMYVVLSILLVGIWANFAYTIINLFKIKKAGKELELKSGIQ